MPVATAPDVFESLRRHCSSGLALGGKLMGMGAHEVSAEGAVVRLSDGRELLDFGSYGVALLGHRHPAVVAAVSDQLERMPTATRTLANPVVSEFVAELQSRCADRLQRVWLGSDGADAVEVAFKLARRSTGRQRVLAVEGAFHGKTLGALGATWHPAFRTGLEPLLGHVTHVPPHDPDAVAREVQLGDVAALIIEPIQGEGGVRPLPPAVARRWFDDAHAAGTHVISDEIQVGLGRCGPFSVAESLGLDPDAVLFGKALGGGVLPLSAVVASEALFDPLAHDPTWHSSTFGGHPLACAAGLAALHVTDELSPRASRLAQQFEVALRRLTGQYAGIVAEVRGRGLLWGIEMATPGLAGNLLIDLAQNGLLTSPCLSSPQTVRLTPPMVATDNQLDDAMAALDRALADTAEFAADESLAGASL